MTTQVFRNIALALVAAMLSLGLLAGCAMGGEQNPEAQANRNYMAQVNQIMVDLDDELGAFVDAVSRDDVVNVPLQAESALRTLDKLDGLEAPEALADVHDLYLQGTEKLEEALHAYIDLYEEVKAGGGEEGIDWEAYAGRVSAIQETYDEGIDLLSQADEAAASKE